MTTYRTNNPLGSKDPKDLYDNAENFDAAINSDDPSFEDRFGKSRMTWSEAERRANLQIDQATRAAEDAIAAAGAIGPIKFYPTFAAAQADLANIPAAAIVEIAQDETRDGARTRYKKGGAALEFVVNLDHLRADLTRPSGDGAAGGFAGSDEIRAYSGPATVSRMLQDGAILHKTTLAQALDDGVFHWTDADGNTWSRAETGAVDVAWFGAVGGDAERDTAGIQNAIRFIELLPETTTYPYKTRPLRIRKTEKDYLINATLHSKVPITVVTDGAMLRAASGFTPLVVKDTSDADVTLNFMFVFLHGKYNDLGGVLRWGAVLPKELYISCSDIAENGVYIERMSYSRINCEVQDAVLDAVVIGCSCWGMNLDDIVLENFGRDGILFKTHSAANGSSINNPKIWGEFKNPRAGLHFEVDAECNGLVVSGGFIEKIDYGVLRNPRAGLITIDAVDFEYCAFNVIRAVGDPAGYREKLIVRGSFAHSVDSVAGKFYASNMDIEVQSSRLFSDSYDARTDGTGVVIFDVCSYSAGTVNPAPLANVVVKTNATTDNRVKATGSSQQVTSAVSNFVYTNAETSLSSTLAFIHSNGGESGRNSGIALLYVNECDADGANQEQTGIAIDAYTSSFRPTVDNGISCGSETARFTEVRAVNGSINTSDAREKTNPLPIDDAVLDAWGDVNLIAYQWLASIAQKGESARVHFGVIAQQVRDAFAAHGLDGTRYGLLCYDEWVELPEVLSEDGQVVQPSRTAGSRWGIRAEQCLFLEAAYQRREVKKLSHRLDALENQ